MLRPPFVETCQTGLIDFYSRANLNWSEPLSDWRELYVLANLLSGADGDCCRSWTVAKAAHFQNCIARGELGESKCPCRIARGLTSGSSDAQVSIAHDAAEGIMHETPHGPTLCEGSLTREAQ